MFLVSRMRYKRRRKGESGIPENDLTRPDRKHGFDSKIRLQIFDDGVTASVEKKRKQGGKAT